MFFTENEVMQFITENDVKFIRLSYNDIYGTQKNVSIMPSELGRAFKSGISFDASAVLGFGDEVRSDLFLYPDPSTLALLPWRPSHGRVVRFFCDIKHPDGIIFELDSRNILKNAIFYAEERGYKISFGAECEFYLFKCDADGNPTDIPFDNAGYMDVSPLDRGENVRREICLTLEDMGITPEASHHEEGPGQNEIDFKYSEPLISADNVTTFKWVVRTVASRNGLYATFDPKPILNRSGNGFHINMSPKRINGITEPDVFNYFMAGVLDRAIEISAFLNPTEGSYKRLGEYKAPKYVTWSEQNRSQLIRIPAGENEYKRIELRSPDCSANHYIAYALLIYAGIEGIDNKKIPAESVNLNLYKAEPSVTNKLQKLPSSLKEAIEIADKSDFINKFIPKRVTEAYKLLIGRE
ncbi:MAG: type I glutamate--ammonia ligase [Clostridiales bacterium GWF2_36_10]|nr:MAG: type I glutamate--ammonia ligase [Clostridiales bacterium GWF2_36_10]HAN21399.1 type I glutamate--ammonia ligase [Clostridiales bacterium]